MDPVTHGLLGAAVAQATVGRRLDGRLLPLCGAAAAMAPDLDFLLHVPGDPQLSLHRHFTHALAFTPVGAALVAAVFLLAPSARPVRWLVYTAALLGYVTHGLLDTCTTTGVKLYWPFVQDRVSWDLIFIVDPLFTLALAAGVLVTALRRRPRAARIGLGVAAAYLLLGAWQHHRAARVQAALAHERGDHIVHGRVVPGPFDLVWRSVYRDADDVLHADAVRVSWLGGATVRRGETLPAFRDETVLDHADEARRPDRLRRDLARYRRYTEGLWASLPGEPDVIYDMRLSLDCASFEPLWGIRIDLADPKHPVRKANGVSRSVGAYRRLWREIIGRDERYEPAP